MKKYIEIVLCSVIVITLSILGFVFNGVNLSQNQIDTLTILGIVCGCAALYCFVVGEVARNNSQMDKLWSILPIAYAWIMAAKGGFKARLIIIAVLITLWGIRLTFNFARKGAYSLKFWAGEEDYRWQVLRSKKPLNNKLAWGMFDLFFISIYQNALVLAMTLPMLTLMDSNTPIRWVDFIAIALMFGFLLLEFIADEQQWKFHETKKALLREGKQLSELDEPYNKGFNTTGLWGYARHPNYLGEQGFWVSLLVFTIAASVNTYVVFNWAMFGPLFLVFLFLGSSSFGEGVSNCKYPEYKYYLASVSKYIPFRKYRFEKAKAKLDK